jgi:DNA repair exonuclease SbcCD ATPase subunit
MAELGFMESLALGYMAAGSSRLADTGVGVLHDLRHKQALAQASADYATLVDQYNRLVDGYNELYTLARNLEDENARQAEQNGELSQQLAAANARVATLEHWGNDLATREAEARRDADYYKASRDRISKMGDQEIVKVREAEAEIARLQAIIAGMTKAPEDPPSSSPSVS